MFDAVLENAEVFGLEIGNEASLTIQYTDWNCDKTSVDADDIAFSYFFRPRVNNRGYGWS